MRFWPLAALIFVGALVRETILILPAAMLCAAVVERDRRATIRALALGAIAAVPLVALRLLIVPTSHYGLPGAAVFWAYSKSAPQWIHAALIVYGPALALIATAPRVTIDFPRTHKALGFIVAIVGALAWLGGTDTERFWMWASPVLFVLIGRALETVPVNAGPCLRWRCWSSARR